MPAPTLDVTNLTDAVTRAVGLQASATTIVSGVGALITAAVVAALEEDDAADQGSIDAVKAAIDAKVAELNASSDALATALAANTPPADPPVDPSARRR